MGKRIQAWKGRLTKRIYNHFDLSTAVPLREFAKKIKRGNSTIRDWLATGDIVGFKEKGVGGKRWMIFPQSLSQKIKDRIDTNLDQH